MGIFSRMTDIINANLNAMLDKAEDPEKMVRLIIQEMEDTLVEVRSTSVRSIARKKELQRQIAQLQGDAAEWQRKAELAMSKDREDLSRAALAARTRAGDHAVDSEKELKHVEDEIVKLDDDTGKLKAKLADAKQRQKTIILRAASADSRLKVKRQIHDGRMDNAMLKFEQYEAKIDGLEAQLESYDLGQARTLKDQFAELERGEKLEAELDQLRSSSASPSRRRPTRNRMSAETATPGADGERSRSDCADFRDFRAVHCPAVDRPELPVAQARGRNPGGRRSRPEREPDVDRRQAGEAARCDRDDSGSRSARVET